MGFKKGNTIGNRFSKENQPKDRGKRPSLLKPIISRGKLSKEDVCTIITNCLLGNRVEAVEDASNEQINILQAIVSKQLAKGDFKSTMEMLKFVYGTSVEVKGAMAVSDASNMSDEELQAKLEKYKQITQGEND